MSPVSSAAEALSGVVTGIEPDRLTNPTPCAEYDVRALVHHLLQWCPSLAGAGRKELVEPSEVDMSEWRKSLLAGVSDIADAWEPPSAWEGTTRMGGPTVLPAALVGDMILGELVVHGWDLAVATGQEFDVPGDVLTRVHEGAAAYAEQGRAMGVFGPEAAVPESASLLDRILGLTGRDPAYGRR